MVTQKRLPFQYEAETSSETTAFAGLPLYFELAVVSGVVDSIKQHVKLKQAGWEDASIVLAIVLLNLVGANRVEDIKLLERDPALCLIMRKARLSLVTTKERNRLKRKWKKARKQGKKIVAFPSTTALFRYLERFHDPATETLRAEALAKGIKAFIPPETAPLASLWKVVKDQLAFQHHHEQVTTATLDMDATLVKTSKAPAQYCYKGFPAYQPLNVYWYELDAIVYSEFRDGNVPAGFGQTKVLERALEQLPEGVERVLLRADTAGYDWELLHHCSRGKNERFGRINFAVGADVTNALKKEVAKLSDEDWYRIYRQTEDGPLETPNEYAEVCFVPNQAVRCKKGPSYRFIVTREPMQKALVLGDDDEEKARQAKLPFPTMHMTDDRGKTSPYKLHALVTTLDWEASEVIWWLRQRCGKSEEAHAVMKQDLASGTLPSGLFGANAAWWAIMLIALNLSNTMKRLVLAPEHKRRRMKTIRLLLINIAGRLIRHARTLLLKIAEPAIELLENARGTIWSLVIGDTGPPG